MNYDDIIDLPHPVSQKYPRMTMAQRAAQFNPFAALTGYEEAVEETGRYTENEPVQSEESMSAINEALAELKLRIKELPRATVYYFEPDERKAGGAYRCVTGRVKKIDDLEAKLTIDRRVIELSRIVTIEPEQAENE